MRTGGRIKGRGWGLGGSLPEPSGHKRESGWGEMDFQSVALLTFLGLSFLSYEDKIVRFFDFCEPVARQVRVIIHRRSRESTCGARGPAPAREK